LKTRGGFSYSRRKASKGGGVKPALIIGFDAEWVTEPLDPVDDLEDHQIRDPLAGKQPMRNRILSYQLAGRVEEKKWSQIYYTSEGAKLKGQPVRQSPGPRQSLRLLLADFIAEGVRLGHLRQWPKRVILAAHWTRADLSALQDYATIKRQFDGVQKTYSTLRQPYHARATISGHPREFDVVLVDTLLLTPGSSKSLAALGDLYNFPKIGLGQRFIIDANGITEGIQYIERMDWLLADDPVLFERYAVRDAEICAHHVDEMLKFAADELGLSADVPSPTLGSLAVDHLLNIWERFGLEVDIIRWTPIVRQPEPVVKV
jgi:hypothetical protein